MSAHTQPASQSQLYFRARIVPTGQQLPWLQAREAVKDKGGLPPHRMLDRHLCDPEYRDSLPTDLRSQIDAAFPLMAAELYVHPIPGRVLEPGKDIYNSILDRILPWSELATLVQPSEVIRPETGLLVLPADMQREKRSGDREVFVVHPESIALVHPAVRADLHWGEVDRATGMVLGVPPQQLAQIDRINQRSLWIMHGERLGPLARHTGGFVEDLYTGRDTIVAYCRRTLAMGVSYVAYDILDGDKLLVEGVSLADIRRFVAGGFPEALGALFRSQFEPVRSLARESIL